MSMNRQTILASRPAAMVLAVMVVPIITAICREIFLQTPRLHEEAALALGEVVHAVAEQYPEYADHAHRADAEEHHVHDRPHPNEAAVEERETGSHDEHERGAREGPDI